jgi:hypothetical protein
MGDGEIRRNVPRQLWVHISLEVTAIILNNNLFENRKRRVLFWSGRFVKKSVATVIVQTSSLSPVA